VDDEVLSLEDVTKRFDRHTALRGVSFRLGAGESVGYLGPNGAGKTTTLKLLAGFLVPDSGRVRLLGRDPRADSGSVLAQVGALIETPGIAPYLHARDLLEYVAVVRRVPLSERPGELRRVAERLGVEGHLDRAMGSLSTGLARRILLAATVVGRPRLLLLDEPTLGLDPVARRDLRNWLRELRHEGTSMLLSTHLLDDVEEVCERVVFLREGRVVGDEAVRREDHAATGSQRRSLRVRFLRAVPSDRILGFLGPGGVVDDSDELESTLRFDGDNTRQAELLAALIGAGIPVISARSLSDGLGERYLATVGREEDP
jgi:ABC-2 type transport system ATP-binding protein